MDLNPSECLTVYEGHGVQFAWPGYWELSEETDGDDVMITVSADSSCFWTLRILAGHYGVEEVLNSCVDALREDYDDTEVSVCAGTLAQRPAAGREVSFSCFELLNSAAFTCVHASGRILLVWWQGTDHELEGIRPLFEQITQSVRTL